MVFVKSMLGSIFGAIIGIHIVSCLGWLPTYDAKFAMYFAEHHSEIVRGLLILGMAATIIGCLIVAVYALYRMARTID